MMHGHEKSDLVIVAMKPANKAKEPRCGGVCGANAAESVERRAGAKGNAHQHKHALDSEPGRVSQALERIRPAFAVTHPRWEPYAGKPHVRIWAAACDETHVPIATNRRGFITLVGGAATAWPLAARAQETRRNRKIGLLHPGQAAAVNARIAAIREGASEPGGQRDSGIEVVVRLADGDLSRLPALATDLVNDRVDAIVAAGPPAVQAASRATASIPVIAIDLESDPVASGLVASLARPGGNVTGVFLDFPDFSAKCLQLLLESVPALAGVGILWDPTTGSLQLNAVEAAAQGFGIRVQVFEARRVADLAEAFYALDRSRIQGVLMLSSPLIGGNSQMVADLAVRRNVPTISLFPDFAREGGLLAYGPDIQGLYRQAAVMARKVLHGAKPAELPAERPTRFQLVANLRTAKLFGITLPPSILLRADEVIE